MLKKTLSALLALVLVVSILSQVPVKAIAESIPRYLKELKTVTASSKSDAVAVLQSEGYTVVDCDLRSGTGNSVCYMGYKTTTNKDEAITDVRLMNAGGGISEKKYRDLVAAWQTGIEKSAGYLKETCLEVKAQYQKGSPLAKAAVEILDIFEVDGVKLSDYLFDAGRKDTDYQDILLICADNVVAVIYSALNLGTADYGTDDFADRLSKTDRSLFDYDYIAKQSGNATYINYWADTVRVIGQLQDFGLLYDEAVMFFEDYKNNNDIQGTEGKLPSDEELNNYWRQFVDEKYKNSEVGEEQDLYKYAGIMGVYEKLTEYASFSPDYKNLAEYIYTCGDPFDEDGEESDKINYRIYPLVASLTRGQLFTLQYGGVSALVSQLDSNNQTYYNQSAAAVSEIKSKIKENGLDRISVFYNVNRDIYDQTVAFTSEAERVATSSSAYDKLTKVEATDKVTKNLTNIILIGGMVAGCVLAATSIFLGISAAIFGTTALTLINVGYIAILSGSIAIASGGMTLTTGAIVAGIIGTATIILALIVLAIIVICAIIAFFRAIFGDDDEEKTVYPDMPSILFDIVGNNFTEYRAVCDGNGNPTDINGGTTEQWDCLYYTYSKTAGSPIQADGKAFVSSTDSYVPAEGYMAVRRFGYYSTANLNTYKNNNSPLYLFYCSEESQADTGKSYLYDLMLVSGKNAEEARLGLLNKKYNVIEQNLTPNTGSVTYLGFTTTDNAGDAITDIRIAYYYDAQKVVYGTTSSGAAAEYAFVGKLGTQASLYYVKQRSNGSPILADIKITDKVLDADSGYEPVNMFSGGSAFNLIIGSDEEDGLRVMDEDTYGKKLYMYFRPSETFGSTGTEYISGFAFSSGFKNNLEFAAQCGFKPVETLKNHDLTSGLTEQPTYLLYSTTYNPYRAITEIKTYTAQNSSSSLFENIVFGSTGYVACETFACIRDIGVFTTDYYRLLRPSNGYISRNAYEGGHDFYVESQYQAENNLGKYEQIPMKGLYVAGPSPTAKPLTMLDVCFCTDPEIAGRTAFENQNGETVFCKPVADLTDCYSTVAENLTFEWDCYSYMVGSMPQYYSYNITFKNYLRIFYRGSVSKRGKYVSNVYVATVDPEEDQEDFAADQAISKLLSMGEGEIVMVNLARSKSNQPYSTEKVTSGDTYYMRDVYKSSSGKASYIMIQYTDYRIDSMRTATTKWLSSGEKAPGRIDYQSTQFERSGDTVKGLSGDYAIYTCKNGQLGSAITDVLLDSDYLVNGCTTISDCSGAYHLGEDYILKFRHGSSDVCDTYYTDIVVASCNSRQNAIIELYKKGCDGFIDQDKNSGAGGNYVYIGYKTTSNPNDSGAIRGVEIMVRGDSKAPNIYYKDGGFYCLISNDLNKGIGGDYTYLYASWNVDSRPISMLTTSTVMCSSLSKYRDYKSHNWITTENASSNTKAATYKLCYRQTSNDWEITDDGVLYINTNGKMKDYSENNTVFYTRPGAMGAMRVSVNYYPEWSDYGDAITGVSIGDTVTEIDDCAFKNCTNIDRMVFFTDSCVIQEGAIPDNVNCIMGYYGSTAEAYALEHGLYFYGFSPLMGTLVADGNVCLVIVIVAALVSTGVIAIIVNSKKKRKKSEVSANEEKN